MMQRTLQQLTKFPRAISASSSRGGAALPSATVTFQFQNCSYSSSTPTSDGAPTWHGTTILCVRKNGKVCMMGDGQVSQGNMVVKPNARKIRRIHPKTLGGKIQKGADDTEDDAEGVSGGTIVGFAGSTADAFTLLERLEGKLDEYPGQLARSCVELAKGWRTDKYLRRLEASLLVADENVSLEITGNGDVLESHDKVLAVGSGSPFAIAAARALQDIPELSAEEVCRKSMDIASDMCVFTNKSFMFEVMDVKEKEGDDDKEDEKKD